MTFCIPDDSPGSWHKTEFQSRFLAKVGTYIDEHEPTAKLSGAVTYNGMLEEMSRTIMGDKFTPCTTTISFEHEKEHDTFVEWYKLFEETDESETPAIIIADEKHWSK